MDFSGANVEQGEAGPRELFVGVEIDGLEAGFDGFVEAAKFHEGHAFGMPGFEVIWAEARALVVTRESLVEFTDCEVTAGVVQEGFEIAFGHGVFGQGWRGLRRTSTEVSFLAMRIHSLRRASLREEARRSLISAESFSKAFSSMGRRLWTWTRMSPAEVLTGLLVLPSWSSTMADLISWASGASRVTSRAEKGFSTAGSRPASFADSANGFPAFAAVSIFLRASAAASWSFSLVRSDLRDWERRSLASSRVISREGWVSTRLRTK